MAAAGRALICGVGGQDGAYLARFLLGQGYEIVGTTRHQGSNVANLRKLGLEGAIRIVEMDPLGRGEVERVLAESEAKEIYYLAAQSSVWRSFEQPAETFEAAAVGLVNLLEAARRLGPDIRIFNAASGDCFGETAADVPATERSPFAPRSPYAAAKCAAHHAVAAARAAYGSYACSGFLFTHESPLRSEDFVVGKSLAAARRIASGSRETLALGNVEICRDWGWAPDYVAAMWRMLQLDAPEDFVLATGRSHRLGDLVERIFAAFALDWRDHVEIGSAKPRPGDISGQYADPALARERLGWSAELTLDELARRLAAD